MTKTRKFLSLLLTPTLVGTVPIVATSCSRKNEVQDNGLTKKQNDVFTMIAILGMQVPPPAFNIINDQEADLNLIYSLIPTIETFLIKNNLNDCYEIETVKLRDHKLFTEYITFLDDTNQHHTYTIIYITETQSIVDTSGKTTYTTKISGTARDDRNNVYNLTGDFVRVNDEKGKDLPLEQSTELKFVRSEGTGNSFKVEQTHFEQIPNNGESIQMTKYQYTNIDTNLTYYYQWSDQQWKDKIIEFWASDGVSTNAYDIKHSWHDEEFEGRTYTFSMYSVYKHIESNVLKQWQYKSNRWQDVPITK